jgi:hypothetical protein
MIRFSIYAITILAIGAIIWLVGCNRSSTSQLVSGHTDTSPGHSSGDDDLVDHCFRQENPQSLPRGAAGKGNAIVFTISADAVNGKDTDKLSFRLMNLNSAGNGSATFENITDITVTPTKLPDGRIEIRITDSKSNRPNERGIVNISSHLGPGPYMAVISMPSSARSGSRAAPLTLFYYYETYDKDDLSQCAKYR